MQSIFINVSNVNNCWIFFIKQLDRITEWLDSPVIFLMQIKSHCLGKNLYRLLESYSVFSRASFYARDRLDDKQKQISCTIEFFFFSFLTLFTLEFSSIEPKPCMKLVKRIISHSLKSLKNYNVLLNRFWLEIKG